MASHHHPVVFTGITDDSRTSGDHTGSMSRVCIIEEKSRKFNSLFLYLICLLTELLIEMCFDKFTYFALN
ncbi:hypothetical protein VA7868_04261 [Vibrio aerogenes CECT 7868]|uniref:Uncharacterized protein n=1 Tax=Vibrio aerogenes CECT 7868 TaxID=1216006 RepID=A0A1M6DLQ9_9VIBR|nr:hypothetical protein VA7868_04261 [Vibrio aerogenes CECT 7868]